MLQFDLLHAVQKALLKVIFGGVVLLYSSLPVQAIKYCDFGFYKESGLELNPYTEKLVHISKREQVYLI